jgi:hypothetical protein
MLPPGLYSRHCYRPAWFSNVRARGRRPRWFAGVLLVLALATVPAAASAQTAPPTLGTGGPFVAETFVGSLPEVTTNCDPDGTSTVSYETAGTAFGPYPGTYTESGTATIGPEVAGLGGFILTFQASFTIDSPVGQVVGTKTLPLPQSDFRGGTCFDGPVPPALRRLVIPGFGATYEARIQTPSGDVFRDRGTTDVQLQDLPGDNLATDFFQETFASELLMPEPAEQPKPGKGCGDKNHEHEREGECKKPPK